MPAVRFEKLGESSRGVTADALGVTTVCRVICEVCRVGEACFDCDESDRGSPWGFTKLLAPLEGDPSLRLSCPFSMSV